MSPAVASLLALLVAIVLACTTRVNVGLVAIALAWVVGAGLAGLPVNEIVAGFPSSLFLTLAGVTLLFALAEVNGTLRALAERAVAIARGDRRVLPLVFFAIAFALSTVGPGAIASVALVAPLAMAMGAAAGVPSFLAALMVANGANAGNLSPISAVGVIANAKIAEAGLGSHPGKVWLANLLAHALVSAGAWAVFVARQRRRAERAGAAAPVVAAGRWRGSELRSLGTPQWATVAVLVLWIAAVLAAGVPIGLAAFGAAALLVLARVADETSAMKRVPWGVILMVCGVSVLIAVLERTGGMELFTALLAAVATPSTVYAVIALVTGLVSSYSSTSGVVLPAFLPAVPSLVAQVGGGDPLGVALAVDIGSSLVDVSPLSTLGALCVAAVADPADSQPLFRQLLLWGLSMSVVGAALAQLLAPALAAW